MSLKLTSVQRGMGQVQVSKQELWRPAIQPKAYTASTTALLSAGNFATVLPLAAPTTNTNGAPASNMTTGLYVVWGLEPFNMLGLRFLGARNGGDPDGRTAAARLWLLEGAINTGDTDELQGEFQMDLNLTAGALKLIDNSIFTHPTAAYVANWVDTIAETNDVSLDPGARKTGGVGDDIQTLWLDGRGASGFIINIDCDAGGGTALEGVLPLYRTL